ncbi:MAG TPA: hypothetical protein VFM64_01050, partial [Candidatus Nitrosotenuis sp.]|nr:hypothetical protein [Candidatus Nitrosotenuis sp.]
IGSVIVGTLAVLSGFYLNMGFLCEDLGGKLVGYNTCQITQPAEPLCDPGPVSGDGYCYKDGMKILISNYLLEILNLKENYAVNEGISFSVHEKVYDTSCFSIYAGIFNSSGNKIWEESQMVDCLPEHGKYNFDTTIPFSGIKIDRAGDYKLVIQSRMPEITRTFSISEHVPLANQKCAELFDGVLQKLKEDMQRCKDLGIECEPRTLEYVLRQEPEFMANNCADTVNDWGYLSENEDTVWHSGIDWKRLASH